MMDGDAPQPPPPYPALCVCELTHVVKHGRQQLTQACVCVCCVTRRRIALVNWRAAKEAAKAAFRAQAVALGEADCSALGASLVSDVHKGVGRPGPPAATAQCCVN